MQVSSTFSETEDIHKVTGLNCKKITRLIYLITPMK